MPQAYAAGNAEAVCTKTEGCTLAAGHEGECVRSGAETYTQEPKPETEGAAEPTAEPETTEPTAEPETPPEETQAQKIQARIDALPDAQALGAMSAEEQKSVREEIRAIDEAIAALETGADTLERAKLNAAAEFFTEKTAGTESGAASVDGKAYPSLAEAVESAQDGQTVTLLRDTEVSAQIQITKNLTLDLNGHTIINNVVNERLLCVTAGSLTIDGRASGSAMSIPAGNTASFGFIKICAKTELTLIGGKYSGITANGALIRPLCNPAGGVDASGSGITLTDVTMDTNNWFISTDKLESLTLNVTGGYYANTSTCGFGIDTAEAGTLSFSGAAVTTGNGPCVEISGAAGTFEDCIFTAQGTDELNPYCGTAVCVSAGGTALVKSGAYRGNGYGAYVRDSGGAITIEGGTFSAPTAARAAVNQNDYPGAESRIVINGGEISGELSTTATGSESIAISGGVFSGLTERTLDSDSCIVVSGGKFNANVSRFVPEGNRAGLDEDGNYAVGIDLDNAAAEIGGRGYTTLQAAIDASAQGDTIKLLRDCTDSGIRVQSGNRFTLDFDGYTYTIDGTETGVQLLRSSDIVMKNGTIKSSTAKILVQNYCDLTLENMTLDGSGMPSPGCYVLSNNCGSVNITGGTSITAAEGNVAFDVYYWPPDYANGVSVTVDTTGKITGRIEYAASSDAASEDVSANTALVIRNIDLAGKLDVLTDGANVQISGGSLKEAAAAEYCAEGFYPIRNPDGRYSVHMHQAGTPERKNEVAASCAAEGSCDEVTYCELCGAEMSRESVRLPKLAHSFGAWVVTVSPTANEKGTQVRSCAVCGARETQETAHSYVLTHDDTKHWYQCMDQGCANKAGEEGHGYSAWIVTKQPTETETGSRERVCALCGFTQTEELPLLTHTHKGRYVAAKPATCTEAGNRAYYICACGEMFWDKDCTVEIIDKDSVTLSAVGHHDYNENGVCDICTERLDGAKPKVQNWLLMAFQA